MERTSIPKRIRELLVGGSLDDDELASRLGVIRQQVNEAARAMEHDGLVTRSMGPAGKLLNTLVPGSSGEPSPIVLASNRTTASGHIYADRTGISYEYPTRYRGLVLPGARFVYYRSREHDAPPGYFGAGVIGGVRTSHSDPSRLECSILDFRPFDRLVAFKDSAGNYLEAHGDRRGYYQVGVRRITDAELSSILTLAQVASPAAEIAVRGLPPAQARLGASEAARQVEDYAVDRAVEILHTRYPASVVRVMPRNNPGYDIRVTDDAGSLVRLVEVKGTGQPQPVFFMSEGERAFSATQADRYTLIVVYNIDLEAETHLLAEQPGEVRAGQLTPVTWSGRLG